MARSNWDETPVRSVRVPDDLWGQVKWVARDNGETVTAVVIRALTREVRDHFMRRGRRGRSDKD